MRRLLLAVVISASAATQVARVASLRAAPKAVEAIASVDRPVVGLGETLVYAIGVVSTSGAMQLSAPLPGKIDGFDLLESRPSPAIENGRVVLRVFYTLRAKKLGTFTLGPGRVTTGGGDMVTPAVKVQVVSAGAAPPGPKAKPRPKTGPFGDPFSDLFPDDDFFPKPAAPPPVEHSPPADPLARVDALPTAASERNTFVRLAVDDLRPVVGSPMVAKLFVYSRNPPNVEVRRMPAVPDFRIVRLELKNERWKPIAIEGLPYHYGLASAWTLYPLRVGKLDVRGAEAVTSVEDPFTGRPFAEEKHEAEPLVIEAIEPPLEGRPSGYVLGDVASGLALSAEVAPRVVTDGHTVVQMKLTGIGRLDPLRPRLTTPPGVTWTSTNDEIKTEVRDASIEGLRRITFDARFDRSGDIDLGEVAVHVWDHQKKSYVSARASLGHVRVDKPAEADGKGTADLPGLPPPREALGRVGGGSALVDHGATWALVVGAPILVMIAQGVGALGKRRRAMRDDRDASPAEQSRLALEAARRGEEPLANLTRALDRALEAKTNVRARALTRSELARALSGHAFGPEVVAAFDALESARFAGGSPPSLATIEKLCQELA